MALAQKMLELSSAYRVIIEDAGLWRETSWISDRYTHSIFDVDESGSLEINPHFVDKVSY